MTLPYQMVSVEGRQHRKFIAWPGPVNDGTSRCIACGQIDEEPWHDRAICQQARFSRSDGLLPPAEVERAAHDLGQRQREVILGLSKDWGPAPNHQAARRLWYRDFRLVDHRHQTGNCWALTRHGEQVQEYLVASQVTAPCTRS